MITSLGLRVALLLLKFAFLIYLAKISSISNVGYFTLISSTLALLIFILGFEVHSVLCRKIASEVSLAKRGEILKAHLNIAFVISFVSLILWAFIYGFEFFELPSWYSHKLIFLLIVELFVQEIGRYLLMVERPIIANLVQLIRGAIWMIPVMFIMPSTPILGHMTLIIDYWFLGSCISLILALYGIRSTVTIVGLFDFKGLLFIVWESKVFWVVAVFTQVQLHLDKFIMGGVLGSEKVGVYSFYQGLTNAIQTFIQVAVISILLPKLLRKFSEGDMVGFNATVTEMYKKTIIFLIPLLISVVVILQPLLRITSKEELSDYYLIFFIHLVWSVIISISFIPHMILYAMKKDMVLMLAVILNTLFYIVICYFFTAYWGIYGTAISGLLLAMLTFLTKYFLAEQYWRRHNDKKNII